MLIASKIEDLGRHHLGRNTTAKEEDELEGRSVCQEIDYSDRKKASQQIKVANLKNIMKKQRHLHDKRGLEQLNMQGLLSSKERASVRNKFTVRDDPLLASLASIKSCRDDTNHSIN